MNEDFKPLQRLTIGFTISFLITLNSSLEDVPEQEVLRLMAESSKVLGDLSTADSEDQVSRLNKVLHRLMGSLCQIKLRNQVRQRRLAASS